MIENYLRVLQRRWRVIAGVVVCALVGAGVVSVVMPTSYQSTLTMYTSVTTGQGDAGVVYQASLLAQERTRQYVQMIDTTRVAQEIVNQAGLAESPETVASWISASSALESVIINVTVTAPSPELASQVADGVGYVFPQFLPNIDKRPSDVATPINLEVIDSASVPKSQLGGTVAFNLILGVIAGLVVGVLAALLVDARARRRSITARAREAEIELAEGEYLAGQGISVRLPRTDEGTATVADVEPEPARVAPIDEPVADMAVTEKEAETPSPQGSSGEEPPGVAATEGDPSDVDLFVRPGQLGTVDPSTEDTVKIAARLRTATQNNGHKPTPPVTADSSS